MQQQPEKGKIYLLMGYLGSGKTTFIRNLLQNKQGTKYAVIQNQFAEGEMGIQQPLIMDESGVPFSNFLQLPNGCICCSAKNDLMASVEYILNNTDVRNVIVETNGLADPSQSIKQFWFDQQMKINAQLHSIVSIIAVTKYQKLKQQELFNKQIAFGNKILLTFIDKSTPQQIKTVQDAVKEANQQCLIAKNNDYDVVKFLSGENMFDLSLLKDQKASNKGHHHQHKGIDSIFIKGTAEAKTQNQFQCNAGTLLWESGLKILRIKGAACLPDSENIYELQGVDEIFQVKPTNTSKEKFNNETRVLVIGENLEAEKLREILKIK